MKTIGLLGGMSWESTLAYYRIINEQTARRLGGLHSAPILLLSLDFEPIERLQHAGRWGELGEIMIDAARRLAAGGAELLVICTNTMHKLAPVIERDATLPIVHIADATGDAVRAAKLRRIGLLGTRFTMEEDFYRGRLAQRHGLDVLTPDDDGRRRVHEVIYEELCRGEARESSRRAFRTIIDELVSRGAEGIVLGCTEIFMLVDPARTPVPVFDTTALHARQAVEQALGVSEPAAGA